MKDYTEMTMSEISEIVMRGGDKRRKLNDMVREHLDSLELSDRAMDVINTTDMNIMAETFGGLFTAEEVEREIAEQYPE